jgi:hypothetical protein
MKIIILVTACLLAISCNNNSKHVQTKDIRIVTVARYATTEWTKSAEGLVIKIIKDTFSYQNSENSSDQITLKKNWYRDSFYFVPTEDTVKENGKIVLDSLKKPKKQLSYHYLPKELLLIDYNKNIK